MSIFSDSELGYLRGTGRLARLATIGPDGGPQIRPVGYLVNPDGTIDVGGIDNPATQKWRNVRRDPRVALVVDDTGDGPGWSPRWVEVRGTAELLPGEVPGGPFRGGAPGVIRIRPQRVLAQVDGTSHNRTVQGEHRDPAAPATPAP
ncbi:PPOX class F420-dependent oxidoreductase [Pseudonocardia kongjuensis]|uniref:PPOX class F420-dependent oxidoreductase n=1 Tax=Pseudonocardia kongjuensis TaxID=102227 RepID=A0ABP4I773_9PSEU